MALTVTPVPRNLTTKVTFLYLEFEDLFVILGLAVVMNMFGRFLQREMFGIPMNVFLQYVVPGAERSGAHPVQVWETTRIPAGLAVVSHEAACVLRPGARLGTAQ